APGHARDFALVEKDAEEVAPLVEVGEVALRVRAELAVRRGVAAKDFLDFLHERIERGVLDRLEERLLVGEVEVDGALGDPHFLRDALHGDALEPFAAHEADDRLLNALPLEFLPEVWDLACHIDRAVILKTATVR